MAAEEKPAKRTKPRASSSRKKTAAKKAPATAKTAAKAPTAAKTAAKAPARARTRKAAPAPKPEPALTAEEAARFKQLLLEKRAELLGNVDHMAGEALNNNRQESTGDLSSMPIHMADIGTDNYEQEFTLGLIESERKILREIDRALVKIPAGDYGVCEGTGQQINRTRLNARPEARYCIEFARKIEQGLVAPPTEDTENSTVDAVD